MNLKRTVNLNLKNLIGKSVPRSRKIVVFESDDWGSIRMPSLKVYEKAKQKGLSVDKGDSQRYNQIDSLASQLDFEALFNILKAFNDQAGRPPVFTGLTLTSNPDFEAIKNSNFAEYISEPFTDTLKKYRRENAFKCWQQGVKEHLFVPEFHGREHLNISAWMRMLQKNDPQTRTAFNMGFWGFTNKNGLQYQAAFALEKADDLAVQKQIVSEGLKLFEKLHGYKARFFVPPNGPVNNELETVMANHGIRYIGASKIQKEPLGDGKTLRRYHWLGQTNKHGQTYLTRNAFFEPNKAGQNWVKTCLEEIEAAFRWNKPAVISTHRTNYIGSLREENRKHGLEQLSLLLKEMLKRWPDIEFKTSAELGDLISNNEKRNTD